MIKKLLAFVLTVLTLFSFTACFGGKNSDTSKNESHPFDENGNMLCDYYVLNVLINGVNPNARDGYKYVVHRYQNIVDNSWKDLVTYGDKIEQTEHAMAIYTSFGTNEESISFEYYGVPRTAATALKMVLRSELKNSGVYSYEGSPYFCAEVVETQKDRITVAPLEGTIEKYIADTLSVSTDTTGLGITADKISVGDRIRIFYDGGVFKSGINIAVFVLCFNVECGLCFVDFELTEIFQSVSDCFHQLGFKCGFVQTFKSHFAQITHNNLFHTIFSLSVIFLLLL